MFRWKSSFFELLYQAADLFDRNIPFPSKSSRYALHNHRPIVHVHLLSRLPGYLFFFFCSCASFTFRDLLSRFCWVEEEPGNDTHHRQRLPSRLISYYALCYSVPARSCVCFPVIYKLVETIFKGFINGPLARKALPASSMAWNGR